MPRLPPVKTTGAASVVLAAVALMAGSQAAADTGAADVAKLNAQRAAHGIPAGIVEIPDWTRWCDLHIFYMQVNGGALAHIEEPGRPGYTAEGQRAAANSVLSKRASWDRNNPWENAPIHLHQLLAPRLDAMGIADRHGYLCATTLLSRNRPPPTANIVYTYPGNGTPHRFRETAAELPYTPGERVGSPPAPGPAPTSTCRRTGPRSPRSARRASPALPWPGRPDRYRSGWSTTSRAASPASSRPAAS